MACVERVVSAQISASPDRVRRYYVDLENIVDLHPLVVDVRPVSKELTAEGYVQTYRVKDSVPLMFSAMRLPIVYTAELSVPDHGPVRTSARQFPKVRLDSVVTFEPDGTGTRLTERIAISAPRPLLGLTERKAVEAHAAMLDGIRRHFRG